MLNGLEFDGEIGILLRHNQSLSYFKTIRPSQLSEDIRDDRGVVKTLNRRQDIIRIHGIRFFNFVIHLVFLPTSPQVILYIALLHLHSQR